MLLRGNENQLLYDYCWAAVQEDRDGAGGSLIPEPYGPCSGVPAQSPKPRGSHGQYSTFGIDGRASCRRNPR